MFRAIQRRRAQKGFTLIELLIVVAIIGIIAAILIPNLIDALQKAKQKRAVADVRNVGSAWFTWLTDQLSAASAGAQQFTFGAPMVVITPQNLLDTVLFAPNQPVYLQSVPTNDPWGNPYEYMWAGPDAVLEVSTGLMAIRSCGNDGDCPADTYAVGPFVSSDYAQDIVWADGFFIQWPEGAKAVGG